MSANFNLLDRPWLPVVLADGTEKQVGIREALLSASAFRELRDESPVVTAALHRLLLAILHRALKGPGSLKQWRAIWDEKTFCSKALMSYFDTWNSRFNLFDATRPFYQTIRIPKYIKTSPIARLIAPLWNGGTSTAVFNHEHTHDEFTVPVSVAARWLVTHQQVAFAGTAGAGRGNHMDAVLARAAVFLLQGENLFATLMLNLVQYDNERPIPRMNEDYAAWERPSELIQIPAAGKSRSPNGYVDYLTWQSRSILLRHPNPDSKGIASITYFFGEALLPPRPDVDPMIAYIRNERKRAQPISSYRITPDRALWRDCDAFLGIDPKGSNGAFRRPVAIDMISALASRGNVPPVLSFRIQCLGWATPPGDATVLLWRSERFSIPVKLVSDRELLADLKTLLAMAESVADRLHRAVEISVRFLQSPLDVNQADSGRVSRYLASLAPGRAFWSRLESPFRSAVADLSATDRNHPGVLRTWFEKVLAPASFEAFHRTAGTLESSARAHRAAVEGEVALRRLLRQLKHKDFAGIFPVDASQLQEASDAKS